MEPAPVYVIDEGPRDAPALVLAHALAATVRMWEPQREALVARYRVISFDLRGHGDSPVPPGPYTVADLAADALGVLDRLGVARASFVGLSLGGAIGQWLAVHAADRLDRLALLCTSARFGDPRSWRERAALVRAEGTEAVADAVTGKWFTPGFGSAHPQVWNRWRNRIASTPAEGYAACCEAIADFDFGETLSLIIAPTLVIAGRDDPATPPEHAELIAERIGGARLEVLDDAAHVASLQRPDAVTNLLLDHLNAIGS